MISYSQFFLFFFIVLQNVLDGYSSTQKSSGNSTNTTTTENPNKIPPLIDTGKSYTDAELKELSDSAYYAVIHDAPYDFNNIYGDYGWYINKDKVTKQYYRDIEKMMSAHHQGTRSQKIRMCHALAITIKNARTDLTNYYPKRFLYVANLEFEIGYLTEEIISHYQIVVELYHHMYVKYGLFTARYYAPVRYMLFIYIRIVNQCKVIIKLCNMLHELEQKYKFIRNEVFMEEERDPDAEDVTKDPKKSPKLQELLQQQMKIEQEKKRKLHEQKKIRKEMNKRMESGKPPFEFGFKVPRTTRKRPNKHFNLHYGWSFEGWW